MTNPLDEFKYSPRLIDVSSATNARIADLNLLARLQHHRPEVRALAEESVELLLRHVSILRSEEVLAYRIEKNLIDAYEKAALTAAARKIHVDLHECLFANDTALNAILTGCFAAEA